MRFVKVEKSLAALYRLTLAAMLCWVLIVGGSLLWNIYSVRESIRRLAANEVLSSFKRDEAFRYFIASRGGVYVPLDRKTPSNPRLNHPERDIKTTSGKKLTLMNSSYFFRKIKEEYGSVTGVNWRFTSLKPVDPTNRADAWEEKVLLNFKKDPQPVLAISEIKGEPHLRFLSPLPVEAPCLKCHAYQGYKAGEIRGAYGVSLPMGPYLKEQRGRIAGLIWAHLGFLFAGLAGIGVVSRKYRRRISEKIQADEELAQHRNHLAELVEKRTGELRESEGRLRKILDSVQAGIVIVDPESHTIVDVNRVAAEMVGLSKTDIVGRVCHDFICPAEKGQCPVTDLGKTVDNSERALLRAGGEKSPILKTVVPIVLEGRKHLLESFVDITERKRVEAALRESEERLQRAEKMESLGILAGGVAHDLNNVLGVMMGYSELMLFRLEEDSPLREHLRNIMKSSERAAAIVQDMLTLARRGVVTRKALNLNAVVRDQLQTPEYMKMASYHPSVRVKTELEADLLNIKGSPVHLGKTLMNLLSNAAEAIRGEGTVTVRTRNHYLEKPVSEYDQVNPGDYVVLTVSDTGEGISPQDLKRIFEPFYTKKVMGRSGTGLGLSVVWGTVKDHEGYIDVRSRPGQGTTFSLYFPVTREEPVQEVHALPARYTGVGETILVVDDIEEQRELAAQMLTRLNYRVELASSGEKALEYLRGHEVDLVVLDMIMDPGIDGLDTYRKMAGIRPGQKAVIVSGFAETERVRRAQELGAGPFVKKPYILEKIGLAVRRELDRK